MNYNDSTWVVFYFIPQVGNKTLIYLLKHFDSVEDVLKCSTQTWQQVHGLSPVLKHNIETHFTTTLVNKVHDSLRKTDSIAIPYHHKEYPYDLKKLADPPAILFAKGNLDLLKTEKSISIVGTRKASRYGLTHSYQLSEYLSKAGYTIISGLADGIDWEAHRACLENKANTIAVLGQGFKKKESIKTQKLLNANQLILSELPPLLSPQRFSFLKRNRIVAALAQKTIIIEAPFKSGAMNTASHAFKLNKTVYILLNAINQPSCAGSNSLLHKGGIPITDYNDVCKLSKRKKSTPMTTKLPYQWLFKLLEEPKTLDQLIAKSTIPSENLLTLLIELEAQQLILNQGGRYYKVLI